MSILDHSPREFTAEDMAAQQAARDAVMGIPLYPDLSVRLKKALGYGPHVDMAQHLAYWFHPRKPKMQSRWTLFKTFAEWYEECGLTDRQVKKGRNKLKDLGILTWKRGQYGRVHYRVDWLALANLLGVVNRDAVAVPIDDDPFAECDDLDDFNPDAVAVPIQSGRLGVPFNPDALPSDPIQETTQETTSVDSSLQDAPESHSRSGARETNNDFQDIGFRHKSDAADEFEFDNDMFCEEPSGSQPQPDKRHSQGSDTPPEKTAAREEGEKPEVPQIPEDTALLADLREVLNPNSGRWDRVYAGLVRTNHAWYGPYSPERIAGHLATEQDLPYAKREADLVPCLRYLFWVWDNVPQSAEVAA